MQYLYIIKCQEFHKIGIANDVDTRLSQLSTGNPYPLDVVSIYGFPNAETVERALHQRYSDVRVRGEWFGLDDHDISDIDLVCKMLGGELIETVSEVTEDKLDEAEESNVYIPCMADVEKVIKDPNYRLECGWMITKQDWKKGYLLCGGCWDALKGVNVKGGWNKPLEEFEDKTGEML